MHPSSDIIEFLVVYTKAGAAILMYQHDWRCSGTAQRLNYSIISHTMQKGMYFFSARKRQMSDRLVNGWCFSSMDCEIHFFGMSKVFP